MTVTNQEERAVLIEGGRRLALILDALRRAVRPGRSGIFFDALARELAATYEARPSFLGYDKFPAALCVSVNDVVVHGLPTNEPLRDGDVVSFDFGIEYPKSGGLFTDSAATVGVGPVKPEARRLMAVTKAALSAGLKQVKPGARLGDVGAAIEAVIDSAGFGLVRQLVGHGVGRAVHEKPQVPNFGKPGQGELITEGMVLAIEPMVTLGNGRVKLGPDGFSYVSADHTVSAHAEHTVIVTARGPLIITAL